ncbi:antitoxin [Thermococci archaeon]|nr:MAG: antitoxin [Thermococci archaeon]
MTKVIGVIYENGVFRPLKKVNLKEGSRLKIIIKKWTLGNSLWQNCLRRKLKSWKRGLKMKIFIDTSVFV